MININEDYLYGSGGKSELEQIIDEFIKNPYKEGVTYENLSAREIEQIIALLLYQEGNREVTLTAGVEKDGYHLYLRVDKKEK
tara:strand:+ start:261 stop:509 length:249 start_codon:yes stop_codon:yes gene_type:complete